MKRLSVFDISPFIHAGTESGSGRTVEGFPVDGIIHALKTLIPEGVFQDDVVGCFDSATDRKDLWPGYKSGRNRTNIHDIYAQLDFLKEILDESGIATLKVDGFEADDLIYTAIQKLQDNYVFSRIFTNDMDIAHNVTTKVSLEPVSSMGNKVNYRNYKTSIKKGVEVYLGTSTIYKMFCGDGSDKIPAFRSEKGILGSVFYKSVVSFVDSKMASNPFVASRREFLDLMIKNFGSNLTDKDREELELRAKIFYPRLWDGEVFPSKPKEIKGTVLYDLLSLLRLPALLKMLGVSPGYEPNNNNLRERFRDKSRLLSTGAFGAQRGLSYDTSVLDYDSLELRSF